MGSTTAPGLLAQPILDIYESRADETCSRWRTWGQVFELGMSLRHALRIYSLAIWWLVS